jgi:hypothetical protein
MTELVGACSPMRQSDWADDVGKPGTEAFLKETRYPAYSIPLAASQAIQTEQLLHLK